jgi:hypothetical protein
MSYLRIGQEGQYVDIPRGSTEYIYGNGTDINGWLPAEFAALIGQVADEIDIEENEAVAIKAGFRAHFEGWKPDYRGGIDPPERAEIFCQCVDSRIESLKLTDELQEAVQDWAQEFDALRECKYCDTEIRSTLYNDETRYVCDSEECNLKSGAENE